MTATTMPMLETYPAEINLDRTKLAATIDALIACSEACTACADACLSEDMVAELTKCIRTNMDCAYICATTARVVSRHTGYGAKPQHYPIVRDTLVEAMARTAAPDWDESLSEDWRQSIDLLGRHMIGHG